MTHTLHITNGDCALNLMREAGIDGTILPWRDVLHVGPVPGHLPLEELSSIRAQYILDQGWGTPEKIAQAFVERDTILQSYAQYEKVILWFEHDLYDQLQILQILDWFDQQENRNANLSIICTDQYLGMLSPEEIASLMKYETPITSAHLTLAAQAWEAFRSSTPEKWWALLQEDTSVFPFLRGAIVRMLEEYPDHQTGLSRTEQQALTIISEGEKRPGKIFGLNQQCEERIFMGDTVFWEILNGLLESSPPLLKLPEGKTLTLPPQPDQELTITKEGKAVLSGQRSWLDIQPPNRWIGGVHLSPDNRWCWNAQQQTIIQI